MWIRQAPFKVWLLDRIKFQYCFNENEGVVLSVQVDLGHVGQWMNDMVDVLAKQGFESVSSFIPPFIISRGYCVEGPKLSKF